MLTALVTGANRGIGLEFCKKLSKKGYHVIALCRKSSENLEAINNVQIMSGIDVREVQHDTFESLRQNGVDLLINNAGILSNESLSDANFNRMQEQFEVNALGSLRVTMALLDKLNPKAKVALITSRMGSIGDNTSGGYYGYRMSKAAMSMLGKTLAQDLAVQDINVGIYHPGFVKTDMVNFQGDITADVAANRIINLIDSLNSNNTGKFFHSNGEELPW